MAVLQGEYFSQARRGMESFTAILPVDPPPMPDGTPGYADPPWPTVYLLHGYSGGRSDWLLYSNIVQWAMKHGCAVVMPDGGNRFYLDNEETGERYGVMVGEELVEVTRRMFALSRSREDTAIAGLSMGGFGALRNGLKYAQTFGAVMALSSALITDEVAGMTPQGGGNAIAPYGYYRSTFGEPEKVLGSDRDPKWLARQCESRPRLFLACGTEDFLYSQNADYHQYLQALDYPHVWWTRAGVHDFAFWNPSMEAAMDWWRGGNAHGDPA